MNSDEKKVGMSFFNWILSFLGIMFFLSIIVLPPVFRKFMKENPDNTEVDDIVVVDMLRCSINSRVSNENTYADTITFRYLDDQIKSYSKRTEQTYRGLDSYMVATREYAKLSTAYSLVSGVDYSVNTNDVDLLVIISQNFDLSSFKESSITLPGDAQEIKLTSDYNFNDSMSKVKSGLVAAGYTCIDPTNQQQ